MIKYDISNFKRDRSLLNNTNWFLVIKSLDQKIRRKRLLETRKDGKFGRTSARPTSIGLLAMITLYDGNVQSNWVKEFKEPRHIISINDGYYLLSDVNGVNCISNNGDIERRITNKLFAFLHSLDINENYGTILLVASAGYDAVIELDLLTNEETFFWSAWDHGFNPDDDGNWLTLDEYKYDMYIQEGKNAVYIDPIKYGEQGINTAFRSAHPNVAVYNPYSKNRTIIVSIGHNGELYEVNRDNGEIKLVCDQLSQMPHGLWPYKRGWFMTNTTKGEVVFFNSEFEILRVISLVDLPGKPNELNDIEWVQNTAYYEDEKFLCLDANRGIIAIDLNAETYNVYTPDPNWCLQDALPIFNPRPISQSKTKKPEFY